jgi:2-desacetyl-2-hydroxyethyl bacteriochlorophyllide A dehydrogenase
MPPANRIENPTIVFDQSRVVQIIDAGMPRPKAGEVLVETTVSLISTGTELTILSGDFPPDSVWAAYGKYPFVAGYSNIGRVTEVGDGVDPGLVGRRVATRSPHAAWTASPAASAVTIPDNVTDDQAAFFTIAGIVMNSVRRANLRWGESVAVFGLGLLGQFAARFAEIAGASRIFAIDLARPRLAMLPQSPTIVAMHPDDGDLRTRIREANRGRLADVVFEVTGNPKLIPGEFRILGRQGRFIVLSSPRGPTPFDFHDLCNAPSFTIIGTHERSTPSSATPDNPWTAKRNCELFFDYVAERRVEVDSLVSDRVPFTNAPDIYQRLLADRSAAMGVILEWKNLLS